MTNSWAAGWVNGDIPTAAEFAKGVGAIYNTTLGAPAASVDITGIIDDYAHLLIVASLGSDTASNIGVNLRFNNDSAANYDRQYVAGNAASASALESFAVAAITVGNINSLIGASPVMVLVPNYASTALGHKPALALSGLKTSTATAGMSIFATFGSWRSTAAINRVTLLAASGNFAAGSRVTIYGMGG